ncbi:MAG: hypothetical protein IJN48_01600 [Clostridia bacterium]|nr:hypothetical protein [Clostridia bacterium]
MNSNIIKIIACVSMLIDHAGLLLFPQYQWMRWIGRLAMPLFGFFIAEGARHTSNRRRYFLRTFCLGVVCQTVYLAEEILSGGIRSVYLNILFTFSFSMLICFAYMDVEKALESADKSRVFQKSTLFLLVSVLVIAFEIFCTNSRELIGVKLSFDYGAAGAFLPLFAAMGKGRIKQLVCYSLGLILFALSFAESLPYIWFALLDIPILFFYNGERGSRKLKYMFYVFYPLHLGLLYLIDMFI